MGVHEEPPPAPAAAASPPPSTPVERPKSPLREALEAWEARSPPVAAAAAPLRAPREVGVRPAEAHISEKLREHFRAAAAKHDDGVLSLGAFGELVKAVDKTDGRGARSVERMYLEALELSESDARAGGAVDHMIEVAWVQVARNHALLTPPHHRHEGAPGGSMRKPSRRKSSANMAPPSSPSSAAADDS